MSCVQTRSSQGISLSKRIIAKAEVHLHAESSVTRVFGFRIESPRRLHVTDSGGVFCFPVQTGIDPQHGIPRKIVRRKNKSSGVFLRNQNRLHNIGRGRTLKNSFMIFISGRNISPFLCRGIGEGIGKKIPLPLLGRRKILRTGKKSSVLFWQTVKILHNTVGGTRCRGIPSKSSLKPNLEYRYCSHNFVPSSFSFRCREMTMPVKSV